MNEQILKVLCSQKFAGFSTFSAVASESAGQLRVL